MALNTPKHMLPCLHLAEAGWKISSPGADYTYSHDELDQVSKNGALTQPPTPHKTEGRNTAPEGAEED